MPNTPMDSRGFDSQILLTTNIFMEKKRRFKKAFGNKLLLSIIVLYFNSVFILKLK